MSVVINIVFLIRTLWLIYGALVNGLSKEIKNNFNPPILRFEMLRCTCWDPETRTWSLAWIQSDVSCDKFPLKTDLLFSNFIMAEDCRNGDRAVGASQAVGGRAGWLSGQTCLQKHPEDARPLPWLKKSHTQTPLTQTDLSPLVHFNLLRGRDQSERSGDSLTEYLGCDIRIWHDVMFHRETKIQLFLPHSSVMYTTLRLTGDWSQHNLKQFSLRLKNMI